MRYNREALEAKVVDSLIGEKLKEVYYDIDYEGFIPFFQLFPNVQEIPTSAILIETDSGKFISVISTDYAPYYGYLSGIDISVDIKKSYNRPSHITENAWSAFSNRRILEVAIIESSTVVDNNRIVLPFGLKLKFEEENTLYIFDLGIEDYIEEEGLYELRVGGALTIFFNEEAVKGHSVLSLTDLKTYSNS